MNSHYFVGIQVPRELARAFVQLAAYSPEAYALQSMDECRRLSRDSKVFRSGIR